MKRVHHICIGSIVGILHYLLEMGLSYWAVKTEADVWAILFVLFCCLIIAIAVWNVLYKTPTLGALLLRVASSATAYLVVMLSFAYLGVVNKLEVLLGLGKIEQNLQGLTTLFICAVTVVVVFLVIVVKCIVFLWRRKAKNNTRDSSAP